MKKKAGPQFEDFSKGDSTLNKKGKKGGKDVMTSDTMKKTV